MLYGERELRIIRMIDAHEDDAHIMRETGCSKAMLHAIRDDIDARRIDPARILRRAKAPR